MKMKKLNKNFKNLFNNTLGDRHKSKKKDGKDDDDVINNVFPSLSQSAIESHYSIDKGKMVRKNSKNKKKQNKTKNFSNFQAADDITGLDFSYHERSGHPRVLFNSQVYSRDFNPSQRGANTDSFVDSYEDKNTHSCTHRQLDNHTNNLRDNHTYKHTDNHTTNHNDEDNILFYRTLDGEEGVVRVDGERKINVGRVLLDSVNGIGGGCADENAVDYDDTANGDIITFENDHKKEKKCHGRSREFYFNETLETGNTATTATAVTTTAATKATAAVIATPSIGSATTTSNDTQDNKLYISSLQQNLSNSRQKKPSATSRTIHTTRQTTTPFATTNIFSTTLVQPTTTTTTTPCLLTNTTSSLRISLASTSTSNSGLFTTNAKTATSTTSTTSETTATTSETTTTTAASTSTLSTTTSTKSNTTKTISTTPYATTTTTVTTTTTFTTTTTTFTTTTSSTTHSSPTRSHSFDHPTGSSSLEDSLEYDDFQFQLPGSYFTMDPLAYTLTWSKSPAYKNRSHKSRDEIDFLNNMGKKVDDACKLKNKSLGDEVM